MNVVKKDHLTINVLPAQNNLIFIKGFVELAQMDTGQMMLLILVIFVILHVNYVIPVVFKTVLNATMGISYKIINVLSVQIGVRNVTTKVVLNVNQQNFCKIIIAKKSAILAIIRTMIINVYYVVITVSNVIVLILVLNVTNHII